MEGDNGQLAPQDGWVLQCQVHIAAYSGEKDRLEKLLTTDDVDESDDGGRTGLIYAAIADQLECLQLLLNRGATVGLQDASGQTALHWAAATGNHRCVKALLQVSRTADIVLRDADGRTPLHLATSHSSTKCLASIVRKLKPAQLNLTDSEGMTALHWSAYNNTHENIKILLKAGADIVLTDVDGKTAVHWTANNPDDSTIKTLLELAPSAVNLKDNEGRTALHLAVAAGSVPIIDSLCTNTAAGIRCDINAVDMQFRTSLHWAAVLGLMEILGVLMEKGADPSLTDAVGATALHYAAQKDHVECVAGLLSFPQVRDEPDNDGRTSLMWAAQKGNYNALKTMLERGGDVYACDKLGATALHAAALSGHASCVQLLLQHSAKLDAVDANGHTPLFRACERGHTEVVLVLSHAGASVGLRDNSGRSCLHWGASGGHSDICSSLLHHGLPVDKVDEGGRTALQCAAYGGFTNCMTILISEGGADPNIQDSEGITALHWACSVGSLEAVQLLLQMEANFNVMELDGEKLTPLDYAIIGNHQDVAQLLIEQGALSVSSIRELAATMIQRCIRGFLARRKYGPLLAERREKSRLVPEAAAAAAAVAAVGREDTTPFSSAGVVSGRGKKSVVGDVTEEVDAGVPAAGDVVGERGERLVREDKTAERMRELEERLRESEKEMLKLQSWTSAQVPKGVASELRAREKARVGHYRESTKAALVIQLAWRKYQRRKRYREALEKQAKALKRGGQEWQRELAALVIQLAWRQYLNRKLVRHHQRKQRVLHDWSPSVVTARQKTLVRKVYGQDMQAIHYEAPKPRPMVRPAYMNYVASPAALSFNFAIQSYQPQSNQTNISSKRNQGMYSMTTTY